MNIAQSPWKWLAEELRRRDAPRSSPQLERAAVLALRDLAKRGEWGIVKRVCSGFMVEVEEQETGVRYVDARGVR